MPMKLRKTIPGPSGKASEMAGIPAKSALTAGTVVRATTGDYGPADGRAADQARFIRPHVDAVFELEESGHAIGVDVIGDG